MKKIITWNINGYRSITGQNPSKRHNEISNDNKLFAYIEKENPYIICLQEIKAERMQIIQELQVPSGYVCEYFSAQRKGYSGVATFSKKENQISNYQYGIKHKSVDNEGRILITFYKNFTLFNIYFPNGKKDAERLKYKLNFYDLLYKYISEYQKEQHNILICGDYNTAHKAIDIARPKENEKISGFLPEEREKLDELVDMGFVDAFRLVHPNEAEQYSWWSNLGQARMRNIGWRIDYFFASNELSKKIKDCYMQQQIIGSDHCPVVIELDI